MPSPVFRDHKQHIEAIYQQALRSVDPHILLGNAIPKIREILHIGRQTEDLNDTGQIVVIALGKAAGMMTSALLAHSAIHPSAGLLAIPATDRSSYPTQFKVFHAGHPLPTQASLDAGAAAHSMLAQRSKDDVILALISGGGSSLFELPVPGITLGDLLRLNQLLLDSGLTIAQMNIIRSAISQVKGGGLARLAYPARVVSLILSDVVGDRLGSIASGPTVLKPDQREQARHLLQANGLWLDTAPGIRAALKGRALKRGKARRPANLLIGGNQQMIDGASAMARSLGFQTRVLSRSVQGEARRVGQHFARRLLGASRRIDTPTCFIQGGETTVTVRGTGQGGRNQELALSAAGLLDGKRGIALASLTSDGVDGPTNAAGALVDGTTWSKIQAAGLDPGEALDQNNSYTALSLAQALYTGRPTGTNVADLMLGMIYPGVEV